MKYRALVTAEIIKPMLEQFEDKIEFVYDGYNIDHEVMPHNELIEKVADYDILICEYDTIDRAVLDNAKNMKIIICCRGGVKSVIDIDAAMEKKIIICNNGGRNANAVSDLTMGYILDLTRNITLTNNLIFNKIIILFPAISPCSIRASISIQSPSIGSSVSLSAINPTN